MNIALWVIQIALAFLLFAGGATKIFKVEELMKMAAMKALPANGWRVIGVLEVIGALLLIVPGAASWMPELTPLAAAIIAVENLAIAGLYARYSRKLTAANPLVWSVAMGVMAIVVAVGRYSMAFIA